MVGDPKTGGYLNPHLYPASMQQRSVLVSQVFGGVVTVYEKNF